MGFWGVMKELYKGSKQVMAEVNDGLDKLNAELKVYNAEQELVWPLKELRHQIEMSKLDLNIVEMALPEYAKETRLTLDSMRSFFAWWESLVEAGIQDKNGCRDMVLLLVDDFKKETGSQVEILDEFLEEYPLEKLESHGYKEDSKEYATDTSLKIDRLKFAYTIDGLKIEQEAKALNDEIHHTYKQKLNQLTEILNNKFNLSLLAMK